MDFLPVAITLIPFIAIVLVVYSINKKAGRRVALVLGIIFVAVLIIALSGPS